MAQRQLRTWFEDEGILEVTAPVAVANPGMEPNIRPFALQAIEARSHHGRFLHTSPEFAIKATLAEIGHDVFSLGPVFRDEPCSRMHHPEFTMLEWYRLDASLDHLMQDVERIVRRLAHAAAVFGSGKDPFSGSFAPFQIVSVAEMFQRVLGLDVHTFSTDVWCEAAARHGISVDPTWDRATHFSVLYAEAIEPALGPLGPVFLDRFPIEEAALAMADPQDPRVALRMEFYLPLARQGSLRGLEIANAFQELLDNEEQRRRFEADQRSREERELPCPPLPEAMLHGLAALPPTAGIALGWERLLVWLGQTCLGWDVRVSDFLIGEPGPEH